MANYNPDSFGKVRFTQRTAASVPNPPSGEVAQFLNSATGTLCQKNSTGTVVDLGAAGSGAPGGNNTEIQINNSGAFAGATGLTFDAASGLTVPSALVLSGDISPAQITANQDNYNPAGLATAYVLRVSSDNDTRTINGIAGGVDGRILTFINVGNSDISFAKEATTSTAANRIYSEVLLVASGGTCIMQYDGTLQRWLSISTTGDDGNATWARRIAPIYSDFYTSGANNNQPFGGTAVATGTSPLMTGSVTGDHPGVVRILTNATATANSGYYWNTPSSMMKIGGGEIFEAVLKPTTVTGCVMRWGFHTSTTSADSTDGAYFEITTTAAVVGKTANNSVRTTTPTIFTLVAGTWYRFRIEIARDFGSAIFSIFSDQGALLGTQTAIGNLPGASRNHAAGIIATLTAATSSVSLVEIDYIGFMYGNTRPLLR